MLFREPLEKAVHIIGGRWTAILIHFLLDGPKRFSALQKYMGVSHRVLTIDLRKLEKIGIISRTIYPEVPVRVEYQLTHDGLELRPLICNLHSLGKKIIARQEANEAGASDFSPAE